MSRTIFGVIKAPKAMILVDIQASIPGRVVKPGQVVRTVAPKGFPTE